MIVNKISLFSTTNNRITKESNSKNYVSNPQLKSDKFTKSTINNSNRISFTAINFNKVKELTELISTRTHSKKHTISIYESFNEASGLTMGGGLPSAWTDRIKDIRSFDKEFFLERLGEIFTKDRHFSDIDVMSKDIKDLFVKTGIVEETDDVTTEFLEKGFFGRAFKVSINGDDENAKVLKEFKRTFRIHNNHGNFSEQSLAEYVNKYAGDNTDMVKYYYGDTKNGYMVVDYISPNKPHPATKVELDEIGLAYDDNKPRNIVNNYIIDYGGLITKSNIMGNKDSQRVYKIFKYMQDDAEKIKLFNEIYNDTGNSAYQGNMKGLVHSIKFMPKELQPELYKKMYDLNMAPVNVALVENIEHFKLTDVADEILQGLASNNNTKVKEVLAREIKYVPDKLRHQLFEKLSLEDNTKIKKYLARNINHYYRNIANRINIFDNLAQNSDSYADMALINSLKYFGEDRIHERFRRFFEKDDPIVKSALARNIEVFEENMDYMSYWINKLMEVENPRVKRALCESVRFMPRGTQVPVLEKLLKIKDMNSKEFLAENIFSVPDFYVHKEWLVQLLDGADNTVRRSLAKNIDIIPESKYRQEWIDLILENADSSVKKIIDKKLLYNSIN